ncbi:hypothetical protein PR202_gb24022 [Eleusine coracana subsp. coracana]|uniref:DUF6598 domain-containing protein n=1 Tax=Eleusine coracana subsp. coracana TaxID=191504 RepID=A0AAV5FKB6_ELECO|nr:hypothetical protein PR202_gb24022 [Eleusine coracana subsp. coracana]
MKPKGPHRPYTVDDIPRVTCDHEEQSEILYATPSAELRGPSPIRLFPAFKHEKHTFDPDYSLSNKSEIKVSSVGDCPDECHLCCAMNLLQFIDIQIAGYRHTCPGRAKIYGFIAARETSEPLRNYIYKHEIENSEAVYVKPKTGTGRLSLSSPARVISMTSRALIEFELHAQNEDEINRDDDLIIEGCTELDNLFISKSCIQHRRLYGERCALDIKYAVLINAMEARVDIEVLRVPTHGVDLKVYAKTSGFSDVIRLFRGTVSQVGLKKSFAVGVEMCNDLDLFIDGYLIGNSVLDQKLQRGSWWRCSFGSRYHGTVELVAELGDFAAVSVKVTWKTYEKRFEEQLRTVKGKETNTSILRQVSPASRNDVPARGSGRDRATATNDVLAQPWSRRVWTESETTDAVESYRVMSQPGRDSERDQADDSTERSGRRGEISAPARRGGGSRWALQLLRPPRHNYSSAKRTKEDRRDFCCTGSNLVVEVVGGCCSGPRVLQLLPPARRARRIVLSTKRMARGAPEPRPRQMEACSTPSSSSSGEDDRGGGVGGATPRSLSRASPCPFPTFSRLQSSEELQAGAAGLRACRC